MKKLLFVLCALFTCSAFAQTERKVVYAVDSDDYSYVYYYNAQNQLTWMDFGTTHRVYTNNEAGQLAELKQYAWVDGRGEYDLLQTETYEYGADGNVSKKTVEKKTGTETYEYSDYENGVAKKTVLNDRDKYFYDWRTIIEYNDDQTIAAIRTEEFDRDYPDDGYYKLEDYEYTYADGYRATEKRIAYKYDGSVRSTVTKTFTYADLDPKYAPTNIKASYNAEENCFEFSWDPVEGAASYQVDYEGNSQTIMGCAFRTSLTTGQHTISVRAEVDGISRNASFVTVESADPGKLPVATFSIGTIYETIEETESDAAPTRTFYNIPISWTLAVGHSKVEKFYIYYDSHTYGNGTRVGVLDPKATSYLLKLDPYEVADWDEEGNLSKGLDVPIYMTVVYTTGESDKSEVITVNPHKLLGHDTAIEGVSEATAKAASDSAVFNLMGQRAGHSEGIVIKAGRKFIKK